MIKNKKFLFIFTSIFIWSTSDSIARFKDPGTGQTYEFQVRKPSHYKPYIFKPKKTFLQKMHDKIYTLKNNKKRRKFIYKVSKYAKNLKLPKNQYKLYRRGYILRKKYNAFLNPNKYQRNIAEAPKKLAKIQPKKKSPNFLKLERQKLRAAALVALNDGELRKANASFWALAHNPNSTNKEILRDALFAGFSAQRLGWDAVAFMSYMYAIENNIEKSSNYLKVLLRATSRLQNDLYIDEIVKNLKPSSIHKQKANTSMDPVFFSLAKQTFGKKDKLLASLEKKMTKNGKFSERMQLLRALLMVENKQHKSAFSILKKIQNSENEEISVEATINLARLLAIFGQYGEAIKVYKTLNLEKLNRLDSLLEVAWLEYENKDYASSAGKSIGIQSPYFKHAFVPEAYLLEAYGRKKICDFGGAENALAKLNNSYGTELRAIQSLLKKKQGSPNYSVYKHLKLAFSKQEKRNMRRYERYLLQLPEVNSRQTYLYSLQSEHLEIEAERKSRFVNHEHKMLVADALHDFYIQQKAKFTPIIEQQVLAETKYLNEKLKSIFQQVGYISLDISSAANQNQALASVLNYPEDKKKKQDPKLAPDESIWPFEEEFWEDELVWLKIKNNSKCVKKGQAQEDMVAGISE